MMHVSEIFDPHNQESSGNRTKISTQTTTQSFAVFCALALSSGQGAYFQDEHDRFSLIALALSFGFEHSERQNRIPRRTGM